MRPFSVVVSGDPDNVARLVLAMSADGNYVVTAHPETGALERIGIAKCKVGQAFFDVGELNWASVFNKPPEEHR